MKHGEAVTKAITFLIQHASKNRGVLAGSLESDAGRFEHAIAVAGLAEAATFCRQFNVSIPDLDATVVRGGELIIRAASASGGAAFDPLLAAVCLHALKACKQTTLFPNRKLSICVDSIFRRLGAWNAVGKAKSNPLEAGAVGLAYLQWDKGSEKVPRLLRKEMGRDFQFRWNDPAADLPALYFNAYFLSAEGGAEWVKLNAMMTTELLAAQRPDGSFGRLGTSGDGGFSRMLQGDGGDAVHLRTCLAALTLEVYYRYFSTVPSGGAK